MVRAFAIVPFLLLAPGGAQAPTPDAPPGELRVVPPLADPAVVPGVARCTSDGVCTVTDASGTRPARAFAAR